MQQQYQSESESESCSVGSDCLWPMDYIVHGILQARILEWVAILFSRRSSQPGDWTQISHIAGGFQKSKSQVFSLQWNIFFFFFFICEMMNAH